MVDAFWKWALGDAAEDPRNHQGYYEEADLDWVTGVLPAIAVRNTFFYVGNAVVKALTEADPQSDKYRETEWQQLVDCIGILPDQLDALDPEGQSKAYELLELRDPGFRKTKAMGRLFKRNDRPNKTIPEEMNDLDYVYHWIRVNIIPRFGKLTWELIEEAVDVRRNTCYIACYRNFFEKGMSLAAVRDYRLGMEEPEDHCIPRFLEFGFQITVV
jgi:hypothetical protein